MLGSYLTLPGLCYLASSQDDGLVGSAYLALRRSLGALAREALRVRQQPVDEGQLPLTGRLSCCYLLRQSLLPCPNPKAQVSCASYEPLMCCCCCAIRVILNIVTPRSVALLVGTS